MKSIVVLFCICLISNTITSQTTANQNTDRNDWFEPAPKGFNFVPQGSYLDTLFIRDDTVTQTITLAPFWMSNEITNLEFREFTTYLNTYPADSLCYFDWKKAYKENTDKDKIDKNKYRICKLNKEIVRNIIDTLSIKKEIPDYINYFNNKKYDNFPVVGVSFKGAAYFCIWKTQIEANKYKDVKMTFCDYRLPSVEEWKYAASKTPSEKANKDNGVQKVNSGIKNELKLYNLSGNVSEWTSSSPDSISVEKNIVMGGSWKTKPSLYEKSVVNNNTQGSFIGFRLVRSFLGSCTQ